MAWNLDTDRPIYLQLMEKIRADIISGVYQPGDKVPTVRELAAEASVNPNTMQKALTELERIGLLYSQRTNGRFVTEDEQMMAEARESMAMEQIQKFLIGMKQLGFEKEEILDMIRDMKED